MTREQVKELLPIFQAYADGKTVQINAKGNPTNSGWVEIGDDYRFLPSQLEVLNFRIKPEPRVFLAALYDQTGLNCVGGLFDTKEAATRSGNNPDKLIKVREVLE